MEKEIQRIRELERAVFADIKNANNIVEIRKIADSDVHKDVRIAAAHALRRVFVHFAEEGKVVKPVAGSKNKATEKFYSWFMNQYSEFQKLLCGWIGNAELDWSHELCVRTMLELVKFDHLIVSDEMKAKFLASGSNFGLKTYRMLLDALVQTEHEIDVDLVLMLKDEFFIYNDCTYFALLHFKALIANVKDEFQAHEKKAKFSAQVDSSTQFAALETSKKNIVDFMRVLSVPLAIDAEEEGSFYMQLVNSSAGDDDEDADSLGDDSDDDSLMMGEKPSKKSDKKTALGKRKAVDEEEKSKKKSRKVSQFEKLTSVSAYQKLFSKTWLALLSLPFSMSEHKILLKHLPDNVVVYLVNPLLLADYLTQSYNCGGVVAVLALESLFQLIAKYNLDYPNFFASLYKLCTVEIFNAKYSSTFMKLLAASLKSTNLPAYLVAAFIKRLAHLALHASSTKTLFCVAQITWLLRQHRPCQVLVQRVKKGESVTKDGEFDNTVEDDIEKSGALQSSLWELELLENHHVYEVTQLAKAIQDPESTSVGAFPLNVDQYLDQSYTEMFETDLNKPKGKKNAELAFRKPAGLYPSTKIVGSIFG